MNLLPNTAWQINSGVSYCTKYNYQGTGNLPAIALSGYTTGSNTVTASCATPNPSTSQLKVGDLVMFDASADSNMQVCSMWVESFVQNSSFTGRLPRGLKPSATHACQARPIMIGDYDNPVSGAMADGWDKDAALGYWIEDNACNLKVWAVRAAAFKKTSSGSQIFRHDVPQSELPRWRGRTFSFGIHGMQKIRGGSGTWRVNIVDSGSTTSSSSASTVGPIYQDSSVTATVSDACTTLSFQVELLGNSGDVYYFCGPRANIGNVLEDWWPTPGLFPARVMVGSWLDSTMVFDTQLSNGDYGFAWMPYQESNGRVAKDVLLPTMTIESRCGTANNFIALRSDQSPPVDYSYVRYSDPINSQKCSSHICTLNDDGVAYFYGTPNTTWYNASMELNGFFL